MKNIPKPYEIYRHFKGNLYQITAIAKSSEDLSLQVVYQQLYAPFEVYVRPLDMFMSPVDRDKYPEAAQEDRFELISDASQITASGQTAELEKEYAESQTDIPYQTRDDDLDADEALDPLLLEFLDADTYEDKLNILVALHARMNQDMLSTIAMALDIEVAPGELEDRYEQIRSCLTTFEKYECNRLR